MTAAIQPDDLGFFCVLAASGRLDAAARELGVTTPAVSRHLARMERALGVALVARTTRRMALTPEGELYLAHARRILGDIDDLEHLLGASRALRACSHARQVASGTSSRCSRCDAPLRSTMPFTHARRATVFAWTSSTTSSPARSSPSTCGPSSASIRAMRTRTSSAVAILPQRRCGARRVRPAFRAARPRAPARGGRPGSRARRPRRR
jgi:DNA-binding transcriptional LysR family regulator